MPPLAIDYEPVRACQTMQYELLTTVPRAAKSLFIHQLWDDLPGNWM